jgi:uncharacterized phage infection (PIP) family protein YhgE
MHKAITWILSVLSIIANIYFCSVQFSSVLSGSDEFSGFDWLSILLAIIIYTIFTSFVIYNLKKVYSDDNTGALRIQEFIILDHKGDQKQLNKYKLADIYRVRQFVDKLFDEANHEILGLADFARNSISIGFLGTLAGLVLALAPMNSISELNAFEASFRDALSGMFLAFYTSIAGIITSLALSYNYFNLQKKINTTFVEKDEQLADIERNAQLKKSNEKEQRLKKYDTKFGITEDEIPTIQEDLTNLSTPIKEAVGDLSQNIVDTLNVQFKESIDHFVEGIDKIPENISDSTQKMIGDIDIKVQRSVTELEQGYKKRVKEIRDTLVTRLDEIEERANQHSIAQNESVQGFIDTTNELRSLIDNLPDNTNSMLKEIKDAQTENLAALKSQFAEQAKKEIILKTEDQISELVKGYDDSISSSIKPIDELAKSLREITGELNTLATNLKTNSSQLPESIGQFDTKIGELNTTLTNSSDSLKSNQNDLSDSLGTFNRELSSSNTSFHEIKTELQTIKDTNARTQELLQSVTRSVNDLSDLISASSQHA